MRFYSELLFSGILAERNVIVTNGTGLNRNIDKMWWKVQWINVVRPDEKNKKDGNKINPLTPNDPYRSHTAPLTSKVAFYLFIQQIYVLNILNMVYTLRFFALQNTVCFIILTYLFPVLFIFYIQGVLKLKKNNSGAKRLNVYSTGNIHARDVRSRGLLRMTDLI